MNFILMLIRYIYLLPFIVVVLLTSGCDTAIQDDNYFYVVHKDAKMPVWVTGNISSKVFVLVIHGGPGDTSSMYTTTGNFEDLEKKYAFVYWDQRGAGMSLGNPANNTFTIEQFSQDLDLVIDIINAKYEVDDLFLFGHSWGGTLGTYYLSDSAHQAKVKGWIMLDGGYNYIEHLRLSRLLMIDYAKEHKSELYWQNALEWYKNNPKIVKDNFLQHVNHVSKANGYFYDDDTADELSTILSQNSFTTSLNYLTLMVNKGHYILEFDETQINLTHLLPRIRIPTQVMWGKHDYINPLEMAQPYYDGLGTSDTDKYLEIFMNSGHLPNYTEPDKFESVIMTFINNYI